MTKFIKFRVATVVPCEVSTWSILSSSHFLYISKRNFLRKKKRNPYITALVACSPFWLCYSKQLACVCVFRWHSFTELTRDLRKLRGRCLYSDFGPLSVSCRIPLLKNSWFDINLVACAFIVADGADDIDVNGSAQCLERRKKGTDTDTANYGRLLLTRIVYCCEPNKHL